MTDTNILELYCGFKGWQGGTIHQVRDDFNTLPLSDKDRFCGILLDNSEEITDFENMNWFFTNRVDYLTNTNINPDIYC